MIDINNTDQLVTLFAARHIPCNVDPRHAAIISLNYNGDPEIINQIQAATNLRRWQICRIAYWAGYKAGIPRRQWTQKEIDYLIDKFGLKSIDKIAKYLGRTRDSVLIKSKKLGIHQYSCQGFYNAMQLSKKLGIDRNKIYKQWIPGGLKTINYSTKRTLYMISPEALRAFFSQYPEAYDYVNLRDTIKIELGLMSAKYHKLLLPLPPVQKKVICSRKNCKTKFWVNLYKIYIHCPKCGSMVPSNAAAYRGQGKIKPGSQYDNNSPIRHEYLAF